MDRAFWWLNLVCAVADLVLLIGTGELRWLALLVMNGGYAFLYRADRAA